VTRWQINLSAFLIGLVIALFIFSLTAGEL